MNLKIQILNCFGKTELKDDIKSCFESDEQHSSKPNLNFDIEFTEENLSEEYEIFF